MKVLYFCHLLVIGFVAHASPPPHDPHASLAAAASSMPMNVHCMSRLFLDLKKNEGWEGPLKKKSIFETLSRSAVF